MKTLMMAAMLAAFLIPSAASAEDACEELRLACQMKRQLGEQGQGNCRAWRQCKAAQCGDLREACMRKVQQGTQGEGNCRRYRDTCRN